MSHTIAVIGAGVMGSGIAQVLAVSGNRVILHDVDAGALDDARRSIRRGRHGLDASVSRGRLTAEDADAAESRIELTGDLGRVDVADVVLEAVPEDLELKMGLFRRLDRLAGSATVFASNSSGLPITALAAVTERPDKVIGWHWASPPVVMALAEIVRTPHTSDWTVELICGLATRAGKHPVVVNDQPRSWGYVVNRIYGRARREAELIVGEGVATEEQIDQLMIDAFRWPVGPFGMVRGATTGWKTDPSSGG